MISAVRIQMRAVIVSGQLVAMPVYEAYGSPEGGADSEVRLLRDGRNWIAFAFAPVWLIFNFLWLEFSVWLLVAIGLIWFAASGFVVAAWILALLPAVYLLLEGNRHVARRLARQGWRFLGVVEADSMGSAEVRWHSQRDVDLVARTAVVQSAAQAVRRPGLPTGDRDPDHGFGLLSGARE